MPPTDAPDAAHPDAQPAASEAARLERDQPARWTWVLRTALGVALAVAAMSATAAGDPLAPADAMAIRAMGPFAHGSGPGAETELQGESVASAEMIRLVPA